VSLLKENARYYGDLVYSFIFFAPELSLKNNPLIMVDLNMLILRVRKSSSSDYQYARSQHAMSQHAQSICAYTRFGISAFRRCL